MNGNEIISFVEPLDAEDAMEGKLDMPLPLADWNRGCEEIQTETGVEERECFVDRCYSIRFDGGEEDLGWYCSIWVAGSNGLYEDVRATGGEDPDDAYDALIMSIDAILAGYSQLAY